MKVQEKLVQPVAQSDQPGVDNAYSFHNEKPWAQHMIVRPCKGDLMTRLTERCLLLSTAALLRGQCKHSFGQMLLTQTHN